MLSLVDMGLATLLNLDLNRGVTLIRGVSFGSRGIGSSGWLVALKGMLLCRNDSEPPPK